MIWLLAQDPAVVSTATVAWAVGIAAGIVTIGMAAIKLLDRLYLEPRSSAARALTQQSTACRYDHATIMQTESRMEEAIAKMANAQSDLMHAIQTIAQQEEHRMKMEEMRHDQVMKSLQLIERKLDLVQASQKTE